MRDALPAVAWVELHLPDGTTVTHDLPASITPTARGWTARLDVAPFLTVGGGTDPADVLWRLLAHWIASRTHGIGDP